MKRNSTSAVGALHPVLFMLLVYVMSVFLAFFVCRTVYFSLHAGDASSDAKFGNSVPVTALK